MRVLAVDTTTADGSVALADGDFVVGEVRLGRQQTHSRTLLPAIEFLLGSMAWLPGDVDAWAVASGPGSFTGLRVGISTIQGLALASGRPCIGVSALDALAARVAGTADRIAAMMDAFRGEVYARVYDSEARPLEDACVVAPAALFGRLPPGTAFTGDGARAHRAELEAACPGAVLPVRSPFLAGAVARLATLGLAAGEGRSPEQLRPLYLRGADIRKPAR